MNAEDLKNNKNKQESNVSTSISISKLCLTVSSCQKLTYPLNLPTFISELIST